MPLAREFLRLLSLDLPLLGAHPLLYLASILLTALDLPSLDLSYAPVPEGCPYSSGAEVRG